MGIWFLVCRQPVTNHGEVQARGVGDRSDASIFRIEELFVLGPVRRVITQKNVDVRHPARQRRWDGRVEGGFPFQGWVGCRWDTDGEHPGLGREPHHMHGVVAHATATEEQRQTPERQRTSHPRPSQPSRRASRLVEVEPEVV